MEILSEDTLCFTDWCCDFHIMSRTFPFDLGWTLIVWGLHPEDVIPLFPFQHIIVRCSIAQGHFGGCENCVCPNNCNFSVGNCCQPMDLGVPTGLPPVNQAADGGRRDGKQHGTGSYARVLRKEHRHDCIVWFLQSGFGSGYHQIWLFTIKSSSYPPFLNKNGQLRNSPFSDTPMWWKHPRGLLRFTQR